MKIDGKGISEKIGEELKAKNKDSGYSPSLGILQIGDDKASNSFVNVKKKFGEKYGFIVRVAQLSEESSLSEILHELANLEETNDAVILQLPLPLRLKLNTEQILSHISKTKDVDCLNFGLFEAPIVLALKKVFTQVGVLNLLNSKVGIVGLGQVVGLPIKNFLEGNGVNVEVIGRGDYQLLKECDIAISGVGSPHFIKKEYLKKGCLVVDYGCSFSPYPVGGVEGGRMCGDFDPGCADVAAYFTPVPGCMGPLVVASLFENVYKAKENKNK
jgi:methylenetetrahydrofolate dehydrogenase (NADP+)/methenyltetrahydrofolate cyclohydrolase/formyltetrahydrofolate synthetase